MNDIEQVVQALFAGIEAGDIAAVQRCYAKDVVVWHNNDGLEQGRDANLATLRWCVEHIAGMRYEDVRRYPIEGGLVQQHVLRGTAPSGADLEVPACMVVQVRDGLITRIDEYLDSAQVAVLLP